LELVCATGKVVGRRAFNIDGAIAVDKSSQALIMSHFIIRTNIHVSDSWTNNHLPPLQWRFLSDVSSSIHVAAATEDLRFVVCDPNADITLQSSDNILFKFYKKRLEVHSGVFAGAEAFTATDEPVMFTEPSEIVDLLPQLMSCEEQPDLLSVDFNTLDLLAEAVEKYQVIAFKLTCGLLMQ
jgi:hypothetical protein